jgi:hypothetical protein
MRSYLLDSRVWAAVLLSAAVPAAGCSKPAPEDQFELALQASDTLVGPDAPITLTVTATNSGDAPVTWGEGSSSCQFSAIVLVGTDELPIGLRPCTMDLVPLTLGAGETRTESWEWRGDISPQGRLENLPSGEYRIQASAGTLVQSDPLIIRVVREPASTAGS